MVEYKCKECNFKGEKANFAKPCPRCGKDTITAFLNKKESEIARMVINQEIGGE